MDLLPVLIDQLFEFLNRLVVTLLFDDMLGLVLILLFLRCTELPLLIKEAGDLSGREVRHLLSEAVEMLVLEDVENSSS